jgi:hypothetical protein
MILFTGRSIHITKMPNKPISEGYSFFCKAEKRYVSECHPSSNAVGGGPVDVESHLFQHANTGKMVHHWIRRLHQRHRTSPSMYARTTSLKQNLCWRSFVRWG